MYNYFPADFPVEVYQRGIDLKDTGVNEIAWNSSTVLEVVDQLNKRGFYISGGDVYVKEGDQLRMTYDTWYINQEGRSWEEYVKDSRKKAIDFITQYTSEKSDNVYFVLVFGNVDIDS